jgi:hypothetical protein
MFAHVIGSKYYKQSILILVYHNIIPQINLYLRKFQY